MPTQAVLDGLGHFTRRVAPYLLMLFACSGLSGCATVNFRNDLHRNNSEHQRADVLNAGRISSATRLSLIVAGTNETECRERLAWCLQKISGSEALNDEMRLSAQSELWLDNAISMSPDNADKLTSDAALDAYVQSARAAYAYLFFTRRTPESRTFEIRQAQVVGFYNYAVSRALVTFFNELSSGNRREWGYQRAGWKWLRPDTDVVFGPDQRVPSELIPADGLSFKGMRSDYRRDGLGATFVAVAPKQPQPANQPVAGQPWRQPQFFPLTGLLVFPGESLDEVLGSDQVQVVGKDPYQDEDIHMHERRIPLAGNFTAPYGIWLARSKFNRESKFALFGRDRRLTSPRVLVMRPFDPDRLTIVMIHGLASSPDAWIDAANAMVGFDTKIRRKYQIWQVFYPTNAPIAVNRKEIQDALEATLDHFDPQRTSRASRNMVLIGHSMGGVIARLLVSSSDDKLWDAIPVREDYPQEKKAALDEKLRPYLQFEPMPEVTRAIFLAAPHRGSPFAHMTLGRFVRSLIRLPKEWVDTNKTALDLMREAAPHDIPFRLPTSVDNLSERDPFVRAASSLRIAPWVKYHSIIGNEAGDNRPLQDTSDGIVPYWSSHLDGADSELIVHSSHGVQENTDAMLEIRRILHVHLDATAAPASGAN